MRVSRISEAVTSVTPHSRMHVGAGPERRRAKREQPAHECGQFRPAALMTTLRVTAMMRSCSQNSFSSVIIVLSLPTRTCPERLQSAAHPTCHQHLSALDWRFSGTRKRLGFFLGKGGRGECPPRPPAYLYHICTTRSNKIATACDACSFGICLLRSGVVGDGRIGEEASRARLAPKNLSSQPGHWGCANSVRF